jgi:putative glycosyltransferase (TIGR04372 family)
MFYKTQRKRFLLALKNRSYSTIIMAFLYVVFRFLGLLFAVPAIIILWALKPFVWIKIGGLHHGRIGHLALNTDLFMRRRQLGIYPDGPFYCFVSNPNNLANRQLLNMWKRVIPVYESRILSWLYYGMLPILKRTPFHQGLPMDSNEYFEFNNANTSLRFTPEEIEKGSRILDQMGVDFEKFEFVCIFARDDAYLKNITPFLNRDYQNTRNADIDNLVETAKYLIEKGFVVIRVGSIVKKPINFSHERMIDYPYSGHQSDFMDIFLLANCKFVISSGTSGMTDVAAISDRPMLGVNIGEFGHAPMSKKCLYIPKKYKYLNTDNYLHFKDALNLGLFWNNPAALGLETEENSSQEILEATKEMLARLENRFSYSSDSEKLIHAYYKLWRESTVSANLSKTPIGESWLKTNQDLFF